MFFFLHKELQIILDKSRIDILQIFYTYWYRDLTAFPRNILSIRRQHHDDGVDTNDLDAQQDGFTEKWHVHVLKEEKLLILYKNITVLEDTIFNMLDALGPHAVEAWGIILLRSYEERMYKTIVKDGGVRPHQNRRYEKQSKHWKPILPRNKNQKNKLWTAKSTTWETLTQARSHHAVVGEALQDTKEKPKREFHNIGFE